MTWSVPLAGFGLIGLYLAGKRSYWGWVLGLLDEALWIVYAFSTQQWAFVVSALAYGCIYVHNLQTWMPRSVILLVGGAEMVQDVKEVPPRVIVPGRHRKSLSVDLSLSRSERWLTVPFLLTACVAVACPLMIVAWHVLTGTRVVS